MPAITSVSGPCEACAKIVHGLMLPVVSIVGKSKSGKTTLLELLIAELRSRGYRLAAIKHTYHFTMDQPGKDSWRLREAGCQTVILSSPEKMALVKQTEQEATLEELLCLIGDGVDLVITEGFKRAKNPKIEVHRTGGGALACPPEELLAVVTDEALDINLPQYSHTDAKGLADLIESNVLASRVREREKD